MATESAILLEAERREGLIKCRVWPLCPVGFDAEVGKMALVGPC